MRLFGSEINKDVRILIRLVFVTISSDTSTTTRSMESWDDEWKLAQLQLRLRDDELFHGAYALTL